MTHTKNTKKSAAVKRKPVIQKSYNVAELREQLSKAVGALIALDVLITQMMKDKR